MEQKALRQLESQCIQEEPALCTAACPLHVDGRSFVGHIAQGRWEQAKGILNKTMPFPGILGRICEHPCENLCKRREAGDPIAISELERACVQTVKVRPKLTPLPARGKAVAVLGSGMDGLTVALDLAKKGYTVHLREPDERLGGTLCQLPQERLPASVIAAETAVLEGLGVWIELGATLDKAAFEAACGEFDAVYISLDIRDGMDGDWAGEGGPSAEPDPLTLTSSRAGVFISRLVRDPKKFAPAAEATQGRKAATSIDRYLQNASLTAGREKEGPIRTRLYTRLEGVEESQRIPLSDPSGYQPDEAEQEAARCLQCECLECVKLCPYLEHYKGYPKRYAREIYNNAAIVKGVRQANTLINTCSLCGLCQTVCPEDFSMADLCLKARQDMVQKGKMPPSAHEFALLDMAFSNSDKCRMARHAPGTAKSDYLFFPGCQLSGSAPEQVAALYDHLGSRLNGDLGVFLGCCGAPAGWAGNQPLFEGELGRFREQWDQLGNPRLILACSACYQTLRPHLPEDALVSLWEILDDLGLPPDLAPPPSQTLAVIDPCTVRHEGRIREKVRALLQKLGADLEALEYSGELTECCGYGGLMSHANPEVAQKVLARRVKQSDNDYLAYCAMCRDHLAGAGKRTMHLLDLIWPQHTDPGDQPRLGYSRRQENRARLKADLLKRLWKEAPPEMERYERIRLEISPEVLAAMEARRILKSDIQALIHHAETGKKRFYNPKTQRYLARYRPVNVCFWAEYSPTPTGYRVHNAYCHRMEVESA